jgi:chromosome segregation ATPase
MVAAGAISAGIGALGSIAGSIFGASRAKKAERAAKQQAAKLNAELTSLENQRQGIINPYANTKDLSGLIKDTSGAMSNQYANLGVAVKAAEMQIETADLSLANTLDTLRETGNSAGGATALAQAALKSKQGVTANIEAQEAENEKLKAQGEQQLQQVKMQEAQRIQTAQLSEGQRTQTADAAGQAFMFNAREDREMQKINRVASQLSGAQAQASQARADYTGAITAGISGVAGVASSYLGSGLMKGAAAPAKGGFNAGSFSAPATSSDYKFGG